MSKTAFDDLEPRIGKMLRVILRNREAICRPTKGTLELHFKGRHLEARLTGVEPLVMDDENGEPPSAA